MKFLVLTATILFSLCAFNYGQEINSYNLNVKINVAKRSVEVCGDVNLNYQGHDTVSFILWKNTNIHEIKSGGKNLIYNFDTAAKSPVIYIQNGKKLTVVRNKSKEDTGSFYFNYTCDMHDVTGWGKSFTDEWVEMGYYSAWFPVNTRSNNFTSELKVTIDSGYIVSGSGIVTKENDTWKISQPWAGFDNVIIASRDIKSRTLQEGNSKIEVVYATFSESGIDSILLTCKEAFEYYKNLYGPKDGTYMKFVLPPVESNGGGYSRKNFIVLRAKEYDLYTIRGIAHEIGHFWWHNASATTWHDWLNESFAEYSQLLFVRHKLGDKTFNELLDEYGKSSKKTPPIWGIDRARPEAYSALYEKGSLILNEFKDKIGEQKFFSFLQLLIQKDITKTNDFLNLVENEFSVDMRNWFEKKLKS